MERPALILDGHLKSALAAVRSLGVQRIPVYCGAERSTAMALRSRYVTGRFVYTSPKDGQAQFIADLRAAAGKMDAPPVVYAFSDATVASLFAHREELADVLELRFPEPASFELAYDKGATHSEARVHGVPVIKSIIRERREEVRQLAKELSFPVVVKPRHSVVWRNGKGVGGTAEFAHDAAELEERFFALFGATGEAPLVQPFVKGEEYGVELLAENGEVFAETVHHRIRSMSPTGGASVVKETIEESELTEAMRRHSYTLVRELSWSGPMMVEWKLDADAREPKLMELNGRWWGSLPLSVAAGVDFPYLYYRWAAEGEKPDAVVTARPNVVTRHFLGDLRHLLRVFFSRDPMRPYLYPTRRKALKDFFRNPRGTKSDVWKWSDPLPFFMEYIDILSKLIART